jgi:hypothetical protein
MSESKKYEQADAAEAWREVDKLCKTIRYLIGIAERGEGRKIADDEPIELFVLNYVKKLEAQREQMNTEDLINERFRIALEHVGVAFSYDSIGRLICVNHRAEDAEQALQASQEERASDSSSHANQGEK